MSEKLEHSEEQEQRLEQVRLGDRIIELNPTDAAAVRTAFESLAGQYGAALENFRAQALQSIGTSRPMPEAPQGPDPLMVPDPDLLFQNKQGWTDQFAGSLQNQLGGVRQETAQLVQGAVQAFQAELNRRDKMQEAKQTH